MTGGLRQARRRRRNIRGSDTSARVAPSSLPCTTASCSSTRGARTMLRCSDTSPAPLATTISPTSRAHSPTRPATPSLRLLPVRSLGLTLASIPPRWLRHPNPCSAATNFHRHPTISITRRVHALHTSASKRAYSCTRRGAGLDPAFPEPRAPLTRGSHANDLRAPGSRVAHGAVRGSSGPRTKDRPPRTREALRQPTSGTLCAQEAMAPNRAESNTA